MVSKPKNSSAAKRDILKWTERMDDAFIHSLIDQQMLGNRIDNVFTTTAYDNMLREMQEKIGVPLAKDHLKNRLKSLKNNFKECFVLFNGVSGFQWCPETKMFSAKPDVWKAFVQEKPEAKRWMTAQISHYDKLTMLFAHDRKLYNGENILKPKAVGAESCHFLDVFDKLGDLNETNDGTGQLATPVEENSQDHSQSATSSRGRKRKARKDDVFEREFRSITEAIKDVAEAIREGNIVAERGRPRVYTEQEVFEELVNIGVERHLLYKTYMFLIANAGRTRAFFGCLPGERKDFLLQIMYGSNES